MHGAPPTPLLLAEEVTYGYNGRPALASVSLSLRAGQVLTLIGPNGSGKSTLIKLCLGHLRASAGKICWDGRGVHAWPRRILARHVAYLPQTPAFEPEQKVIDSLRLGRAPYWRAFGLEGTQDERVVREVAELLDLVELLDRRMDELSGGQRQRVFVGRCLVQQPRALLLDEPNTYLDLRHQVELLQLLQKLARERQIGVVMASHDLNLAGAFGDELLLLEGGRVMASGPPGEVLRPELLSAVYGVPLQRIEGPHGPLVFPRI